MSGAMSVVGISLTICRPNDPHTLHDLHRHRDRNLHATAEARSSGLPPASPKLAPRCRLRRSSPGDTLIAVTLPCGFSKITAPACSFRCGCGETARTVFAHPYRNGWCPATDCASTIRGAGMPNVPTNSGSSAGSLPKEMNSYGRSYGDERGSVDCGHAAGYPALVAFLVMSTALRRFFCGFFFCARTNKIRCGDPSTFFRVDVIGADPLDQV